MSERPTPETDAEVIICHGIPDGFNPPKRSYVTSKFARKLERERDEALIDRANGDIATMTINHYERILRESDEARKERDQLKEALLIMENLLKPGIELFPEIGQFLKGGKK